MPKIRSLLVTFKNEIPPHQITAFRAAIIEKVGRKHLLFHNHLDDNKYLYQYPLIQYKSIFGKPAIVCLEEGVDELHKLFEKKNWTINVLANKISLEVDRLEMKSTDVTIAPIQKTYRLQRWQAFNEQNHKEYIALNSIKDKLNMLEQILKGNIISFAKGIKWQIEEQIILEIKDISFERMSKMKDIKVNTFDLIFTCNLNLPNLIGLGKGVSKGFGVVKKQN